jgi:hypothetical protein
MTVQPLFSTIQCKTLNLFILTCYSSRGIAAMVPLRPLNFFCRPNPTRLERIRRIPLNPLECALPDKHRVLPVFGPHLPPSSPLEATLTRMSISVHSKGFTTKLTPLDATLTKNRGAGGLPTFNRSNVPTFQRSASPIAAHRLWCHNPQRHEFSLRSGETTPLPPVSKTKRADIGNCPPTLPIASRAWVQRSITGFRVCTYKL